MVCDGCDRTKPLLEPLLISRRQRQQHPTLPSCIIIGILFSLVLPTVAPFSLDSSSLSSMMLSLSSSSSCKAAAATATTAAHRILRIPRHVWRPAALQHQECVRQLLEPALLPLQEYGVQQQSLQQKQKRRVFWPRRKLQGEPQKPHNKALNSSRSKNNHQQLPLHSDEEDEEEEEEKEESNNESGDCWFRPLDPRNPVCNFLIEYYGLKGLNGVKRLSRWSPSPNLLLLKEEDTITSLQVLEEASSKATILSGIKGGNSYSQQHYSAATGVFLEDVTIDDFATLLHLRGAILQDNGALYSPYQWFNAKQQQHQQPQEHEHSSLLANDEGQVSSPKHPASAYMWFRSILQQTLQAEPILHCHGLLDTASERIASH